MTEEWRIVVGNPRYEVSNLGRLRGTHGTLKAGPDRAGYPRAALYVGGRKSQTRKVHSMVMEAFVGPRPAGMEVRHLDGNKLNNRLDNLAYGTSHENKMDTVRLGRHPNASKVSCPQGHPLAGGNLVASRDGFRRCRECARAVWRKNKAKKRSGDG